MSHRTHRSTIDDLLRHFVIIYQAFEIILTPVRDNVVNASKGKNGLVSACAASFGLCLSSRVCRKYCTLKGGFPLV